MTRNEIYMAKALAGAYPLPPGIKRLTNALYTDLMFGYQVGGDPDWFYPGFESAIDAVRKWADANLPSELWYDIQAGVLQDSEPEAYEDPETGAIYEPEWSDFYQLNYREITRLIFGKVVAEYL